MPTTYICETCSKSFKTNQHLTQHKNRKNKCKPVISNQSHQGFDVNTININNSDYSVSNIIQLVLSYKTSLDKISELENVIEKLKDEIKEQKCTIDNLRIMEKTVCKFVNSYTCFHINDSNSTNEIYENQTDLVSS